MKNKWLLILFAMAVLAGACKTALQVESNRFTGMWKLDKYEGYDSV